MDNAGMSETTSPPAAPSPNAPARVGIGRVLLYTLIVGSFLLNIVLCGLLGLFRKDTDDLPERHIFGDDGARDKVAVIRIEGVLMEGMTRYYIKQIEQAARDEHVKAVVLRIDSPGGTVSASDELHRLLTQLRDGKVRKHPGSAKKLVVSMGAIAASGGYYIAMPAEKICAETTTITGSIGVYASLPNVAELINRNGIKFELVKAGAIKASGSPFHELTPQERQPWQDMVDSAYEHFVEVVEAGRPNLQKGALRDEVVLRKPIALHDEKGNVLKDWLGRPVKVDYERRRADGGTFTSAEAMRHGLVDEIGDLGAAVDAAAASAGISKYDVVVYDRQPSLLASWLGIQLKTPATPDAQQLANAASPRLWFLAPGADLAGILAGLGRE
jgi:protease-4